MNTNKRLFPYIEHFLDHGHILKIDSASKTDMDLCVYMDTPSDAINTKGIFPQVIADFDNALREQYKKEEWAIAIKGFFWREMLRLSFFISIHKKIHPIENFLKGKEKSLVWVKKEAGWYTVYWECATQIILDNKYKALLPGNAISNYQTVQYLEKML